MLWNHSPLAEKGKSQNADRQTPSATVAPQRIRIIPAASPVPRIRASA
jgi:hypothetical protein